MQYYQGNIDDKINRYRRGERDSKVNAGRTNCPEDEIQTHVHEFVASTKLAEECDDRHNHRLAGVTTEMIPLPGGDHKHVLLTNTDFYENHHHELGAETGGQIDVGNGKHIHFVTATTTLDDGHFHQIVFATLIDDPIS